MTDYQPTTGYPTTPRYPATPDEPTTAFPSHGLAAGNQVDSDAGPGDEATAKEKAADAAQAGKQAAGEVAQTAVEHGKEIATEAQDQARNLVSEARGQLQDHARDQHRNAVSNLRSLGDELNSMANNGEQSGPASQLVRQAAERTHSAANWLDGRQPQDVLNEVGNFARRRPGAFLLGALAAGVVAGRLTRGTIASHSNDSSDDSGSNGRTASTGVTATGTSDVSAPLSPQPSPTLSSTPSSPYETGAPGGLA
jgi:hypothetical protein